jgi:hypothetical protein
VAGVAVQPVTIAPGGASTTLARDVNGGDGLLLLAGAFAGSALQIQDGPRTEYHMTAALTAADGYYHLNGIGGVEMVDLTAHAGVFADLTQTRAISYNNPVNVIDFRLQ